MNNVYDAEGVCGDAAYVSHDAMLNPVTSVRSCARVEPCLYITFSHFVNITSTIGARDMSDPWLSPQRPFAYASRKHRGALDLLRACPPHRHLLDTTEPGVFAGSLAGLDSWGASPGETASTFSGAPTSVETAWQVPKRAVPRRPTLVQIGS